jgi:hypothetical protein
MKSPIILNKELAESVLNWAINLTGKSDYETRKPKIRLYKATKDYFGIYSTTTCSISLYMGSIEASDNPLVEFVSTILHELAHYYQPIDQCYLGLEHYFGYENNPLEKEANNLASNMLPHALTYIIGLIVEGNLTNPG